MTDGFVNVTVEQHREGRHKRYYVVMEMGDGRRSVSPPFATLFAANRRAEQVLAEILRQQPNADVLRGDQQDSARGGRTALGSQHLQEPRHGEPRV